MGGLIIGLIVGYTVGIVLYGIMLAQKGTGFEDTKLESATRINEQLRERSVIASTGEGIKLMVPLADAVEVIVSELID